MAVEVIANLLPVAQIRSDLLVGRVVVLVILDRVVVRQFRRHKALQVAQVSVEIRVAVVVQDKLAQMLVLVEMDKAQTSLAVALLMLVAGVGHCTQLRHTLEAQAVVVRVVQPQTEQMVAQIRAEVVVGHLAMVLQLMVVLAVRAS